MEIFFKIFYFAKIKNYKPRDDSNQSINNTTYCPYDNQTTYRLTYKGLWNEFILRDC